MKTPEGIRDYFKRLRGIDLKRQEMQELSRFIHMFYKAKQKDGYYPTDLDFNDLMPEARYRLVDEVYELYRDSEIVNI